MSRGGRRCFDTPGAQAPRRLSMTPHPHDSATHDSVSSCGAEEAFSSRLGGPQPNTPRRKAGGFG